MSHRPRRFGPAVARCLFVVLVAQLAPAAGAAQRPPTRPTAVRQNRIFLSARAPWGEPGAVTTLRPACGDSAHRDTLYLCFEPATDESTFYGVAAEFYVYAQPGDTLGDFWAMEHGGANTGGMVVQFGPDETLPGPQPWPTRGIGTALYDHSAESGRFRCIYAMPMGHAGPVRAGTRYVLGRILLGARRPRLPGCERPVCIEWHSATVQYRSGEKIVVRSGERWFTRGAVADRCGGRIPAWRPR